MTHLGLSWYTVGRWEHRQACAVVIKLPCWSVEVQEKMVDAENSSLKEEKKWQKRRKTRERADVRGHDHPRSTHIYEDGQVSYTGRCTYRPTAKRSLTLARGSLATRAISMSR